MTSAYAGRPLRRRPILPSAPVKVVIGASAPWQGGWLRLNDLLDLIAPPERHARALCRDHPEIN
jgi:hypothetical protein